MNAIIWTSVAAIATLAVLATHEAGHALALRRYGVPIVEAGLGLPFGPRITLKPTRRRPFRLSISLLLVGAYVTPDSDHMERLEALPYTDQAWYAGAGIAVNAVTGAALFAILRAVEHQWIPAAIFGGIAAVIVAAPRVFCAYIVPALALPVTALLAKTLTTSIGQPSGPVGVARLLHVSSPSNALWAAALVAVNLALFNIFPIYPLDGGRIASALVQRWAGRNASKVFQGGSALLMLGLLAYIVGDDAWWLISN